MLSLFFNMFIEMVFNWPVCYLYRYDFNNKKSSSNVRTFYRLVKSSKKDFLSKFNSLLFEQFIKASTKIDSKLSSFLWITFVH